MAKQDKHLTIEQLSALLDGQLSSQEQAQCDEHLKTCEQCQRVLADLRQTVALLHALPQPALPRSFVLPATGIATPISAHSTRSSRAAPSPTPLAPPTSARRHSWPSYVQTTLRTMSTIAAVVGIFLLLSGLLTGLPHGGGSASSATSGGMSAAVPSTQKHNVGTTTNVVTPNVQETPANKGVTPQPSPVHTATSSPQGTYTNEKRTYQLPGTQLVIPLPDLNTAGGRAELGIVLLLVGMLGFVVLSRQRRRA